MVEYKIKKSPLAKKIKIEIDRYGHVTLVVPKRTAIARAMEFLESKKSWISDVIKKLPEPLPQKVYTREQFLRMKAQAHLLVGEKIRYWNQFYQVRINSVTIRDTKSRWGSCSSKANLGFNFRIVELEESLIDYIIVHELCHLIHLNHSQDFWMEVQKTIPNYKKIKTELKKFHLE